MRSRRRPAPRRSRTARSCSPRGGARRRRALGADRGRHPRTHRQRRGTAISWPRTRPPCWTTVSAATGRADGRPAGLRTRRSGLGRLGAGRAGRGGRPERSTRRSPRPPSGNSANATRAAGTDWALGHRGPLTRAAERRPGCRGALQGGDRAARPDAASPSTSPAPTSSTANGCAARTGAWTPASSSPRARHAQPHRAPKRSPSAPAASCWPPARPYASARSRRSTSSPRRRRRSPGWPATGRPTPRSAPSSSSARGPSSGTCATCSPSSTSAPAKSSARPWSTTPAQPQSGRSKQGPQRGRPTVRRHSDSPEQHPTGNRGGERRLLLDAPCLQG